MKAVHYSQESEVCIIIADALASRAAVCHLKQFWGDPWALSAQPFSKPQESHPGDPESRGFWAHTPLFILGLVRVQVTGLGRLAL
jgi:hypothetical protein